MPLYKVMNYFIMTLSKHKGSKMKTSTLTSAFVAATILLASTSIASAEAHTAPDYSSAQELGLMVGFPPAKDKMVNKSNALFAAPYNRYGYLHMRSFYPTAAVKHAKVASKITKEIDPKIAALKIEDPATSKPVDMDTYLKHTYSDSIVVIKGDKVVYEKYLNGMDEHQPHQMMSVTKSFAGLLGLMAVEDGLASEDEKISKYVPELKNATAFSNATFKQVLNMTNSMNFSEVESDPDSDYYTWAAVLGLSDKKEGKKYANNMYEYLMDVDKTPTLAHGKEFRYQTPKADVVNWVTNKVTNQSFQDGLYTKIWSKIGTDGDNYVLLDTTGALIAGGGLNANPNDLIRFSMMMLNDGKNAQGEQVVSPSIIETLEKGGNIDAFSNGPESSGAMGNKDWSYRAQWWVRHTPGKEAFSAVGVFGQWIYIDKKRDVVIIKQASQDVPKNNNFDQFNLNAFDTIIEHVSK